MARPKITSQFDVQFKDGSKESFVVYINIENKRPKYTFALPNKFNGIVVGLKQQIEQLKEIESVQKISVKIGSNILDALVVYLKDKKADFDSVEDSIKNIIEETYNSYLSRNTTTATSPQSSMKMVYSFTENDIDDLEVGDIIVYRLADGGSAHIIITDVVIKGDKFIADVVVYNKSGYVIETLEDRSITKPNLTVKIKENKILDFKKASQSSAARPSSMPQSMSDIRVETIINRTPWSQGLKDSMLEDFKRSGYFMFSDLVQADVPKTAQKIEKKIDGFASGKNTYLQAQMLADLLFRYAKYHKIPQYPWSASASTQTSATGNIYGIIISDPKYIGKVIEILGIYKKDAIEENCVYKVLLDGRTTYINRPDFIVEGDGIKDKIWKQNYEVLEISETEIKLKELSDDSISTSKIKKDDFKYIEHNYYFLLSDKFSDPKAATQPTAPSQQPSAIPQPNSGDKIYGIIIKGAYSGELVEVKGLLTISDDENVIIYQVLLNGKESTIPRDNFMVEGDIVQITFYGGSSINRKILVLKNDTTIKISKDGINEENWNIGGFDWDSGNVKIIEYYNLHEIFDSKKMAQSSSAQVTHKAVSKPLSDDEKEIDALKKSVADLILLKNMFSPIEFEETIKIGQKIDEKQKKINELNLVIVDKRLKGNKIFDDLFEQSFTPIKNNYNVYVESETENSDFFAPNGEKSMLKNSISSLIRTPLFKEWFGDWQLNYSYRDIENSGIDCSKVIGQNYEPLIVWHGTGAEFSYFRFDNFPAAYFAVNKSYSEWFARMQSGGNDGYTMPFFLNLKNPLDLTKFNTKEIAAKDFFDYMYLMTGMKPEELEVNPIFLDPQLPKVQTWVFLRNNPKMLKKLAESHVYDGIHFYETNPSVPQGSEAYVTEAYITFKPESCKIADPDRGDLILASMKSFLLEKGGKI